MYLFLHNIHHLPSDKMDYTAASGEFTFSSSSSQQCVNITILDDSVFESMLETFSVNIDTSVDRVVLEPNTTVVQIVDNDGEWEGGMERKVK